ncbi:hypothetical protein AB0M02_35045 [Actinoplanes sp. NPDC051861]|uniref:hypothetical protein n=1 Tax=Actinoplanes sp. NPDC051861 TaxID=3155170 RepID=UPI0034123EEE
MIDATRDLLAALDPLSYRERMRHLATWARTSPDTARVCADLRTGETYERQLALTASMVIGDTAGIEEAARDPRPAIRAAALRAAVRRGLITRLPEDVSARERRLIYRTVRGMRAPDAAEAMIGEVRERFGDGEAAGLLAACGPGTVRELLPALEHRVNLAALTRSHPAEVLRRVAERLEAARPEDRLTIWGRTSHAVLSCDPGGVLDLLERHGPENMLPGRLDDYARLAAHDPGRVARLLTHPDRAGWLAYTKLPNALLRRLACLSTDELAPIARRVRRNRSLSALLAVLAPARRGEIYDAAMSDVDTKTLIPAVEVMEALPAAIRIREAARLLTLPDIIEQEAKVRQWSAYLAWPDAKAALTATLASGDAGERADGYRLLVDAARRSRDPRAVAEVLELLGRLRNEQDPVRSAALTALSALAGLLTAESAPRLARLTTDAVEARDASAATTTALSRLAADTLRHHVDDPALTDWALLTIDLVSTTSTVPVLRGFDTVLRRGQETMVFERLREWVERGMRRGWYGPLFALTRALGRRAWALPGLQELLRRAIGPGTLPGVASQAIGYWLEAPRGRDQRAGEVLAADLSAVTNSVVWRVVCRRRTDLLDRVLGEPVEGRFVQAGVRWVPSYAVYADRWLPRQQERFVALQELRARDAGGGAGRGAGRDVRLIASAVSAAAEVGAAGREFVLRHVGSPDVVVAEAALGALIWTDRPDEALPVLLGHAGDDRARVALYAAGRAASWVRPSLLPELLLPVLTGPARVTSKKEAARLLARFGPASAMSGLLAAYADPAAHRDVRAAIVSAARQSLQHDASWAILDAARAGSREEQRSVLAAWPYLIAERHRARYAALIVAACRSDDREVRRAAWQRVPDWAAWTGDLTGPVVDRFTDLGEEPEAGEITRLLQALRGGGLREAFERLTERDANDGDPGGPGSDRPARRRIEALARAAVTWSRNAPAGIDRGVAAGAVRRLADRPDCAAVAVVTLIGLGRLDNLDTVADLCAGRPVLAVRAAERAGGRMRELPGEQERLGPVIDALAGRGDLAGGLLAAALVRAGAGFGWAEAWQVRLLRLREHSQEEVREEALAIDMS